MRFLLPLAFLALAAVLADAQTPPAPPATCGTVKDCQAQIDALQAQLKQAQRAIWQLRVAVDTFDAQDAQRNLTASAPTPAKP